jgi:hypothetical protein
MILVLPFILGSLSLRADSSTPSITIALAGSDTPDSSTVAAFYIATGKTPCAPLKAKFQNSTETVNWSVAPSSSVDVTPSSGPIVSACAKTGNFLGTVNVTAKLGSSPTATQANVDLVFYQVGGLFQRLIVGAEGSGGAATTPKGRYFTDIFLSTPIFSSRSSDDIFGPIFRSWVDTRITSVPQQFTTSVSSFNIASGFTNLQVNQVAEVFEMLGGIQGRVWGQSESRKLFFENDLSRTSISLIASYGGTTPFVPTDYVDKFLMPAKGSDAYNRLVAQFPQVANAPNATALAFLPADHTRFWHQYYGGLRIQSHFFKSDSVPSQLPMRMVDLMAGQDEVVTGGRLSGLVLRADFFQPITNFGKGKITVYVFGTAAWRAGRTKNETHDALVLNPVPSGQTVDLTASTTALLTSPPSNRDFFRFGIGIDLRSLWSSQPAATPKK